MGDEHDRAGILLQVPFEPGDALRVEVVGRLIQQQEVGALEQDLAEGDPPAFAAGEGGNARVAGRQPHGVHGNLDAAVEVPALSGFDGILDPRLLVEQRVQLVGVRPLGQPGVDLVEALEVAPDRRHGDLDARRDRRGVGWAPCSTSSPGWPSSERQLDALLDERRGSRAGARRLPCGGRGQP